MKNILLIGSSIIYRFRNCKIKNYNIINKGISGLITNKFDKKFDTNQKYDYMILYCGNNDIKKNIDKKEVVTNIEQYIDKFQKIFPNTKIIILSILTSPRNHELNLIDDIQYINQKLKKINNIYYLNINRQLTNKKYYYDNIHLNNDGYEKLNNLLNKLII
jgi:lysophospholipase L1-like esterase